MLYYIDGIPFQRRKLHGRGVQTSYFPETTITAGFWNHVVTHKTHSVPDSKSGICPQWDGINPASQGVSSRGDSYFIWSPTPTPFLGGGGGGQYLRKPAGVNHLIKKFFTWHQPASVGICFSALFIFAQILWYMIVFNKISLFDMLLNLACMIFVDPQWITAS